MVCHPKECLNNSRHTKAIEALLSHKIGVFIHKNISFSSMKNISRDYVSFAPRKRYSTKKKKKLSVKTKIACGTKIIGIFDQHYGSRRSGDMGDALLTAMFVADIRSCGMGTVWSCVSRTNPSLSIPSQKKLARIAAKPR